MVSQIIATLKQGLPVCIHAFRNSTIKDLQESILFLLSDVKKKNIWKLECINVFKEHLKNFKCWAVFSISSE